jgi:hypothetical protein
MFKTICISSFCIIKILKLLVKIINCRTLTLKVSVHTRTGLASESGWARVQMSQTRPCVECHEPDFGRLYICVYISEPGSLVKLPEADARARLLRVWAPLAY